MQCRFEDRLAGRALNLQRLRQRIEARRPEELSSALDAIEAARRAGHWVALLLDYELGEWLAPETVLPPPTGGAAARQVADGTPRLTGLVFERMTVETPWPAEKTVLTPPSENTSHAREVTASASLDSTHTVDIPSRHALAAHITSIRPRMARADYLRQIAAIRQLIAAGELYQVNYTQPLDVQVQGDPRALYRHLAALHPVAHGAYIEDGQRTVLSFSPELFVRREGTRLTVRPMKGTSPRHPDPAEDKRLGRELHASVKNRAENLMIVDLLRNDLGRLARPGSVQVPALFTLERYPTVWTMTSTVTAEVLDATFSQILHALFPCGSITGAPKVAAMRRIRQMEIAPRGLYCGAIGWLAPDGDFSLNVAIRTLVLDQTGHGVYSVGGGIVHDSDPELEWQECQWKARLLQDAMVTSASVSA
ncbi:aminodeoxychorismate synthase component I [Bordetella genomosp. 4]|uniref:Aminodeoxychorismate synthase, component I n=1 Tax=Bordetella genomosp. 4 TaxID=463044 RepID=A0A261UCX6_9BORD|nr:aminodeoxychorismate synthase component I [Bordetella genomosp. 4]OZI59357.1 aminodeoxychorismate synthase, component I [Bordetella genomosp. 4]